jgi:hypothetical protein
MGYKHYWRRNPELSREGFAKALEEIKTIVSKASDMGIRLAGPTGRGTPEISDYTIAFNGKANCGHRYRDLGTPWPSPTAEGIEGLDNPISEGEPYGSGPYLEARTCGGNCAGQEFLVDRKFMMREWDRDEHGGYFCRCETNFKPYDLVVTASLIRLKENLGDEIRISTDGHERGFEDAKRFCRELFGWAGNFELEPQGSEIV